MPRIVVGVMGSAKAAPALVEDARVLGRLIAERGWVLLTGGRDAGVMASANAGAREVTGALTIGVLPGRSAAEAAPDVEVAIVTGMGDARNAINVLSSNAIVACGVEGAGTASEVALALKAGVPTILLRPEPDTLATFRRLGGPFIHAARSPKEVMELLDTLLRPPRGPAG